MPFGGSKGVTNNYCNEYCFLRRHVEIQIETDKRLVGNCPNLRKARSKTFRTLEDNSLNVSL